MAIQRGVSAAVKEHFRHTIKRWREDRNLLQKDMAERFNITTSLYSHWENGVRFPSNKKLLEVQKKTGLSMHELVGEDVRRPLVEVPIVGEVRAKVARDGHADQVALFVDDADAPPDSINISWKMYHGFLFDPDNKLVILRVAGGALAPHYYQGDCLFVELTSEVPKTERKAIVQIGDEMYLRTFSPSPMAFVASLLPTVPPMPLPKGAKFYGIVRGIIGNR